MEIVKIYFSKGSQYVYRLRVRNDQDIRMLANRIRKQFAFSLGIMTIKRTENEDDTISK